MSLDSVPASRRAVSRCFPARAALLLVALCVATLPLAAGAQGKPARTATAQVPAYAEQALRSFAGDGRQGAQLRGQLSAALQASGPDAAAGLRDLGDGLTLRSGCRAPICDEKGAVVYDTAARAVVAAALVRPCDAGERDCAGRSSATVFVSARRSAPLKALLAIE